MPEDAPRPAQAAIRTDLGAIFVSMELSRRAWLITSLSPGGGEKMSKHSVSASDVSGLLRRFAELRRKAAARTSRDFPIIIIQEAGLDGFWIHRMLQSEGIESHVVDAASMLTSRRGRRAKTDRIDGETLVRTLKAQIIRELDRLEVLLGQWKASSPPKADARRSSLDGSSRTRSRPSWFGNYRLTLPITDLADDEQRPNRATSRLMHRSKTLSFD